LSIGNRYSDSGEDQDDEMEDDDDDLDNISSSNHDSLDGEYEEVS
jgi:hypothetical protein